jgi:hypothetical protein
VTPIRRKKMEGGRWKKREERGEKAKVKKARNSGMVE